MERSRIDRLIDLTELAAGVFLAAIALITFSSVMLRGFFGFAIPDGYDISRLLLAITVFWGLASTSYRNQHIQVDILWEAVGERSKRAIEIFAATVTLGFVALFTWMLAIKVLSTFRSNEATFDLRLPVWPFHLLAALGILFATVLLVIRLFRLLNEAHQR